MNQRGGKREGAWRPLGRGKYGLEPTKAIRIPLSRLSDIYSLLEKEPKTYNLPLYSSKVQAVFPSPGDDYIDR